LENTVYPLVLALADDATGALEVGAHLAASRIETVVDLSWNTAPRCDALVVNTDSRHREAASLVEALVREASARGARYFFKKTDSTLRGHIADEVAAVMRALPGRPVIYAPAYPALGRTVRGGKVYVDGVPLDRTPFARDPLNPVKHDSPVELMTSAGLPVLVLDGDCDDDLREAAKSAVETDAVAVGTGGFAAFWAPLLSVPRRPAPAAPRASSCLIVNGSMHPSSAEQLERAGLTALTTTTDAVNALRTGRRAAVTVPESNSPAPSRVLCAT
jgi:uncharacterized protein YgbK (DUF1537 family)